MGKIPSRIVQSLTGVVLCSALTSQVQAQQCANPVCYPGEPCPEYRCPTKHFGNLSLCHLTFSSFSGGGIEISYINGFSGATCSNSTVFYTVDGSLD